MRIVIFGATSAIAKATARLWAPHGHRFVLIGRNHAELDKLSVDLAVRGAGRSEVIIADLNQVDEHGDLVRRALESLGAIDLAMIAHGVLGDQHKCERDFNFALEVVNSNALSTMSLLTHLSNVLEDQRGGSLLAIGSVAGDRGKASNYVYGASKAAVSVYMQGLRQRLHDANVHVLTVKPGLVDTPMTSAFKKSHLWTSPDQVARAIVRAVEKRRNVLYAPWHWMLIMFWIRALPEFIFKRMHL